MKNLLPIILAVSVSAGLLTSAARADSVVITLNSSTMTAAPGSTVDFSGTITAPASNTGAIYINSDDFTYNGPGTLDDSPLLNNFYMINPGTSQSGGFFNISVPSPATSGYYTGIFDIDGGGNPNAFNQLARLSFTVYVTPEPASWLLMATGTIGLLALRRRRIVPLCGESKVA